MQKNAPTLKSCCKLFRWAGKAYLLVWRILLHLAGVVFVIPPGFCYVIAEFPIAYCCIWHGSCLGTLHSVAFSRVLREYPVGVRVSAHLPAIMLVTWRKAAARVKSTPNRSWTMIWNNDLIAKWLDWLVHRSSEVVTPSVVLSLWLV